jgi:hypothetical protein
MVLHRNLLEEWPRVKLEILLCARFQPLHAQTASKQTPLLSIQSLMAGEAS